MERHSALPGGLSDEQLVSWLERNAAETTTEEKRKSFTAEEKDEFAHESSCNGREINRLVDVKKAVSDFVTKGTTKLEKDIIIVFHSPELDKHERILSNDNQTVFIFGETVGTKQLDLQRRQNDDFLEKGYELTEVTLFAIPVLDESNRTGTLEYFDSEGNHYPDRTTTLSKRDMKKHFGVFGIEGGMKRVGDNVVDTDTGELREAVGE